MSISRPEPDSYILMQVQHQARTRLQGEEGIIVAIALEVTLVLVIVADAAPAYKAMDTEMNQFVGSYDELQQEAAVTESQIRALAPFHPDLGGQTVAAYAYYKGMIDDPTTLAAHENAGNWKRTFLSSELNPDFFVYRPKNLNETLPWDFIDHGINKSFLQEEYTLALQGKESPACTVGTCTRCGVCT